MSAIQGKMPIHRYIGYSVQLDGASRIEGKLNISLKLKGRGSREKPPRVTRPATNLNGLSSVPRGSMQ